MQLLSALPARWRLYVGTAMIGGCALLMWRPWFPYWMRPEYYEQIAVTEFASDMQLMMRGREDIHGANVLVVGDSMVALWPWEADVLAIPAGYPWRLRDRMEEILTTQRYDMVLIWVGTAMTAHHQRWQRLDTDDFHKAVEAVIATARQHTDRPVVITPMEIPGLDYSQITGNLLTNLDCEVFDSRGVRPAGGTAMYLRDNFHLSSAGFAELAKQMANSGIEVRPEASAKVVADAQQ